MRAHFFPAWTGLGYTAGMTVIACLAESFLHAVSHHRSHLTFVSAFGSRGRRRLVVKSNKGYREELFSLLDRTFSEDAG